uniref:Glucan endo-1,3-beta-D-glucosidase n=2 Tax=Chenopodium quinoa TaxID=63459 RepID=A0A803MKD9_CHEQI
MQSGAIVGVNYGMLSNNLPPADLVIKFCQFKNIHLLRLYEPHSNALDSLRRSNIKVALGMNNDIVTSIAMGVDFAMEWVNSNVVPYANEVDIEWIIVGNEMVPGPSADLIPQAMNNILSGLNSARLSNIKVSTVVNVNVLGVSSPPSASFSAETNKSMQGIVAWLAGTKNPLFINVFPYLALASRPKEIPLDYALFNAQQPIIDGTYKYYSLFEAMVDAFYVALGNIGGDSVTLVVSETGWPTAGNDPYTSKQNAQTYNQKLIDKMKRTGTPRKPKNLLDIFIFSVFNEDKRAAGIYQNWGIHYPSLEPVYPLTF